MDLGSCICKSLCREINWKGKGHRMKGMGGMLRAGPAWEGGGVWGEMLSLTGLYADF